MTALGDFFRQVPIIEITPHIATRQVPLKDGTSRSITSQRCYINTVDEYGELQRTACRFEIQPSKPYPEGQAILTAGSFEVNQYGDVQIKRFGKEVVMLSEAVLRLIEEDSKHA